MTGTWGSPSYKPSDFLRSPHQNYRDNYLSFFIKDFIIIIIIILIIIIDCPVILLVKLSQIWQSHENRKLDNHMTVHWLPACPHRYTNAKFRVVCGEGFLVQKRMATRVLLSINNLEVLGSQLRTKRNFSCWLTFFMYIHIFYIIYLLCPVVWSIEIKRGRENEKVGGKQAKPNERERAAES